MRGAVLALLLGAAGLAALGSLVTSAQEIDPTPCETACQDRHVMCITACGTSNDTIECESACDDRLEDCLRRCS